MRIREDRQYRWTNQINQRLGGAAGKIVARAEFMGGDEQYVVEFYELPGWLLSTLGIGDDIDHVYQVGMRQADNDGYEGDLRTGDNRAALSIIRTATDIIAEWIGKHHPEVFIAGSPDPQKFRIFQHIAKGLSGQARQAGYEVWERETPVGNAVIISKEGALYEHESMREPRAVPLDESTFDMDGIDVRPLITLRRKFAAQTKAMVEDENDHVETLAQTGYWGRAGAGCLIMARSTGRILIPLRSAYVEQPNTWGTWGGAIDQGEDPAEAVQREVHEEAGIRPANLQVIPLYTFRDGDFSYYNFLAVVNEEFEPYLNWETQRAEWVRFGDWPHPLHFGLKGLLQDRPSFQTMKEIAENFATPD